jgi:6-pyruvoyltetrahydropterin/6-carboxytetrahydropterin synthase
MINERFVSEKIYDGFSTVFRQAGAKGTHCRFLHGYGVSFKITFEGDLDYRNWVQDFGYAKRSKTLIDGMTPKVWMDYMFDHTVVLAKDDCELETFKQLDERGVIQLRIVDAVGAERFAQYIFHKMNPTIVEESQGRVKITKVKFMEHAKNTATYIAGVL